MEIRLRPELEAVVLQDMQRGAYQTVDEYIERAVSILHEQETWLAANQSEIAAKIEEGYHSAQQGELIDPEEVRSKLAAVKARRSQQVE